MKKSVLNLALILCSSLISACGPAIQVVPKGVYTLTGTLTLAHLSTSKRGTHELILPSLRTVLIEAGSGQNATALLGKTIRVEGEFHANIDPHDPPFFIAKKIVALKEDLTSFSIGSGVVIDLPSNWSMITSPQRIIASSSGASQFLIIESKKSGSGLLGTTTLIAGFRAMKTETQAILDLQNGTRLSMKFSYPKDPILTRSLKQMVDTLLRKPDFIRLNGKQSSSTQVRGSGATLGQPCGGTAGILCPDGSFCAIDDPTNNIGHCRNRHL